MLFISLCLAVFKIKLTKGGHIARQRLGVKKMNKKNRYLVALPVFKGGKGFNHPTLLVSAKNKTEALLIVMHLRPSANVGDIMPVDY